MSETSEDGAPHTPKPPAIKVIDFEPFKYGGGEYSSITLKEPTLGQKRTAVEHLRNGTNAATYVLYEILLLSLVTGWDQGAVQMLPVTAYNEAMNYLTSFLSHGRQTGWI